MLQQPFSEIVTLSGEQIVDYTDRCDSVVPGIPQLPLFERRPSLYPQLQVERLEAIKASLRYIQHPTVYFQHTWPHLASDKFKAGTACIGPSFVFRPWFSRTERTQKVTTTPLYG